MIIRDRTENTSQLMCSNMSDKRLQNGKKLLKIKNCQIEKCLNNKSQKKQYENNFLIAQSS